MTADELLGRGKTAHEDDGKLGEAEGFLRGLLSGKAKPHREIVEGARANGISDRTLRRAREKLSVVVFQPENKTGKRGSPGWLWRLQSDSDDSADQPPVRDK